MASKDAEKEGTDSEYDDANLAGSRVESSKQKKLKQFYFIIKKGKHIYLTADQIKEQKKLEELAKADMAKQEVKLGKEELVDLLGINVVTKYYIAKLQYEKYYDKLLNRRAQSRITNYDVLTRKSLITLKPIRRIHQGRYGVSTPELHKKPQRLKDLYAVSRSSYTPYSKISSRNILEYYNHGPYSKKLQYAVKMDNPDITMEEYIWLEEEKARRRGRNFDWKSATYGKVKYFDDVNYFRDFEVEFPAIVFHDALISEPETPPKPTVSLPKGKKINLNFKISFYESDGEDYTFTYDKNLFSYKLVSVSNLKSDSVNNDQFTNLELGSNNYDNKTND
ncbi:hypothetical protein Tco_0047664 [Tanacetum coccineum]